MWCFSDSTSIRTTTSDDRTLADVVVRSDVGAMVEAALEAYGRLDILVNNAGFSHNNQPMLDVSEADFDRTFAVNVKSIYLSALEAVPQFRKQGGGCIINTSSTAAIRPRSGLTWYNGSKGVFPPSSFRTTRSSAKPRP